MKKFDFEHCLFCREQPRIQAHSFCSTLCAMIDYYASQFDTHNEMLEHFKKEILEKIGDENDGS